ncbi:hypothetical protein ASPWEDRAFT_648680 [Aspergillus wentii DTO 134E9]|uniref:Uncharacterized protein n=1 Tax=Aspergillus wentii DTO 134E9 TaxID=1073089 RepID=A0A1L9RB28_ASPWE|nr:uncharacterized protein ASPWEDRAFT_648680 [Aspergillus wentii DTO 134E9]OJJ32088.1 hypothetical protein ASPWEDRAFT_648680 [Aspergillus wentii DTO 134E9]
MGVGTGFPCPSDLLDSGQRDREIGSRLCSRHAIADDRVKQDRYSSRRMYCCLWTARQWFFFFFFFFFLIRFPWQPSLASRYNYCQTHHAHAGITKRICIRPFHRTIIYVPWRNLLIPPDQLKNS